MIITQTKAAADEMGGGVAADRFLAFSLAEELFAVEVPRVLQIRSWGNVIPAPDAPDYVLGVAGVQGADSYVVDLRKRLALRSVPPNSRTLVVVLRFSCNGVTMPIGFAVDFVSGVHEFDEKVTEPPTDLHSPANREFIRGVTIVDNRQVLVLETDRLIDQSVLASWATARVPDNRRAH